MRQQSLAAQSGFERYGKKTRREQFLEEMEQVVPWAELPEATVTLFAACHAPQFTSRYGTIGVGAIMIVNTCVLVTPAGFV
jgi:hypothetical protein